MYNTPLQINTGVEEYVVPTLEGCLKDSAGKFYSTQNAIRVHEWLRGTETTPLVLEAKVKESDGTFLLRRFGSLDIDAYAERYYTGQLLALEQHLLAVPAIQELIRRNLDRAANNEPGADPVAFTATMTNLMKKIAFIQAFSASAMFFQHQIPRRVCMETLETLDILFTCVLTQRRKLIYKTDKKYEGGILPTMFNKNELGRLVDRVHAGSMDGYFPEPTHQAKLENMLDVSFYKQCVMAISSACAIPIPVSYIEQEPTQVYFWAVKILNDLKDRIPTFQVRPKIQNVTQLYAQR